MFTRLGGERVRWADGIDEEVDVVLFATGFRPALSHLDSLRGAHGKGALDGDGMPVHRYGVSENVRGLGFVGLEWQRGLASATLRGVGSDAAHVLARLG
jgi:putative flavoprotein involved in K+ transport